MNKEIIDAISKRTGGIQYYAIERIKRQDPLERSNSNKNETLKIFLDAGMNRREHNRWRDSIMLWHMQWYALAEWYKLNRQLIEEDEAIEGDQDIDFIKQPEKLIGWRNTSLTLKELELIAAEEYVKNKNRQLRPQAAKAQQINNTQRILTWEEMRSEILNDCPGISGEAVRQATYRAIKNALEEKQAPPIPIKACLKDKGYAIQEICNPESMGRKLLVENCKYIHANDQDSS